MSESMSFDLGGAWMLNKKLTDNGKGVAGLASKGLKVRANAAVLTIGFNLKY
jgi:hypothetical protein